MVEAISSVRAAWRRFAGDEHDNVIEELIIRHAEPHRHYHTIEHVASVLRHLDDLTNALDEGLDCDALRAAALFHDAIYDPRSPTNEADSARLARLRLAELGWPQSRLALVESLVVATAGHTASSPAEAVLLDADLAILGASPHSYDRYVRQVRSEYAEVPDDGWRVGRSAVLRSFLDRERIFSTEAMFQHREGQARINLAGELAALEG